jgi:hypothetical protein
MKDNRRTSSQHSANSLRRKAQEFFLMDTIENILRSKPTDVIVGAFIAVSITLLTFIIALLWGNYTVAVLVIFIWIMSP